MDPMQAIEERLTKEQYPVYMREVAEAFDAHRDDKAEQLQAMRAVATRWLAA